MIVLGADIMIDFATRSYAARVARKKAKKWSQLMRQNMESPVMEVGEAAKHAGKTSFAVTVAADRCGRAYVRMLHRQATLH